MVNTPMVDTNRERCRPSTSIADSGLQCVLGLYLDLVVTSPSCAMCRVFRLENFKRLTSFHESFTVNVVITSSRVMGQDEVTKAKIYEFTELYEFVRTV